MKTENKLALKIAFEMNEWEDCLLVIEDVIEDEHKAKVEAISDEDIVTLIKWVSDRGFDNIHSIDVRLQYKRKVQQLLKQ
jgi:hypothetical protein